MVRPRDPRKFHNLISARENDFTKSDIDEIVEKTGLPRTAVIRTAIEKGLPATKAQLLDTLKT